MTQLPSTLAIKPGQTLGRLRFLLYVLADLTPITDATKTAFTSFQLQQQTDQVWADVGSSLTVLVDGTDDEDTLSSGTVIAQGQNCYSVDITISGVTGERCRLKITPADGLNVAYSTVYQISRLPTTNASGHIEQVEMAAKDRMAEDIALGKVNR